MSTPNNPVQPQTKKDEAEVLASFQLAHDHHHVGDTNASDARAQKMQNVSVVMEDTRKMLERSGFYNATVALAVVKLRAGDFADNNLPSLPYKARNEKKQKVAETRRKQLENKPKKSRFKPGVFDPAASASRK